MLNSRLRDVEGVFLELRPRAKHRKSSRLWVSGLGLVVRV